MSDCNPPYLHPTPFHDRLSNMTDKQFWTTQEVAETLGISRDNLLTWLNRYPEYRPVTQMGAGSWVWTATDIERAQNGRTETRSRKPHRRKKKSA